MRTRHDVLVSGGDMGTSGTKSYKLDYQDPISEISIRISATTGSSANVNNPIERCISKIEVVDGSEVLWSLPGDVAYALFTQLAGKPGNTYNTGGISDGAYIEIPIRWGRFLWDPVLAFDPRKFKNPQLKITFDEATVRAAGVTGYVSDSFAANIMVHLMENAPAPRGFLMAKMIYDFTSLGSGDEVVPMPTDYPYRMIMVRCYESGQAYDGGIDHYKLNCDGGKFIPFDMSATFVQDLMTQIFPIVEREGYDYGGSGDTFQTWLALNVRQTLHSHTTNNILAASSFWPSQFTANMIDHAGAGVSNKAFHWSVAGWSPHNTMFIPFGRPDVIEEWFNAQGYGKINLNLTQGNAGAEVNVCLQQLRTY